METIGRFTIKHDAEFGDSLPLTIWEGNIPVLAIVGDNKPEENVSEATWNKARRIASLLT